MSFSIQGDPGIELLEQLSDDPDFELLSATFVFALIDKAREEKKTDIADKEPVPKKSEISSISQQLPLEQLRTMLREVENWKDDAIKLTGSRLQNNNGIFTDATHTFLQPEFVQSIIAYSSPNEWNLAQKKGVIDQKFSIRGLGGTTYPIIRRCIVSWAISSGQLDENDAPKIRAKPKEETAVENPFFTIPEEQLHTDFETLITQNPDLLERKIDRDEITRILAQSNIVNSTRYKNTFIRNHFFENKKNSRFIVNLLATTNTTIDFKTRIASEKPDDIEITYRLIGPEGYLVLKRAIFQILSN
ncbi:MAG: hypothetical protein GW947_02245 [Candidatus Pacebacteria bacterium]|nr:hypothetical protein [Candidatus Paceibacterota bacterium]